MSNPRVEEVSDSDSDPPDTDIATISSPTVPSLRARPPQPHHPSGLSPSSTRPFNPSPPPNYKYFRCLYPLYFDSSRTRSQGRRVSSSRAVSNPLAREIVDACQQLGLKTVFEPGKQHPKDWGNPGRVRVEIPEGDARVNNKHHLYTLISTYLHSHPTLPSMPLRLRIQGMPPTTEPPPPPAVPRGWKLNSILPLHSPALSGGGVSENILKDMMDEMQGQPGTPQGGGGGNAAPSHSNAGQHGHGRHDSNSGAGKRKREGKKK